MRDNLSHLVELACGLPALAGEAEGLRHLARDASRMAELGSRPLRVALVGSTGAGKSTLLNALAGQTLAEEGTERPTSREAVAYAPEGVELGRLQQRVGRVVRYPAHAAGAWAGQILVDTPDLNSLAHAHADVALGVLEEVDVAVVVLHRGSVAEARPTEALRPFAKRRALLLVLNHADLLGRPRGPPLSAQAARVAVEALGAPSPPPVYVVSAARVRAGHLEEDWPALVKALRPFAEEAVARDVRGRNRNAVEAQLRERVALGLKATVALEETVKAALEEGLAGAHEALVEDFRTRLALASAELQARVRRAAAAHLSGPAAWGLRLSAWSGGGLLGGTLLARASLPAGLLVAATGAVLDEVQSRTRASATRARMAGGDEPLLEAQARAALTPRAPWPRPTASSPPSSGFQRQRPGPCNSSTCAPQPTGTPRASGWPRPSRAGGSGGDFSSGPSSSCRSWPWWATSPGAPSGLTFSAHSSSRASTSTPRPWACFSQPWARFSPASPWAASLPGPKRPVSAASRRASRGRRLRCGRRCAKRWPSRVPRPRRWPPGPRHFFRLLRTWR